MEGERLYFITAGSAVWLSTATLSCQMGLLKSVPTGLRGEKDGVATVAGKRDALKTGALNTLSLTSFLISLRTFDKRLKLGILLLTAFSTLLMFVM